MQPFCQNTRKLCQSLAKGKSQRAPVQSFKGPFINLTSCFHMLNFVPIWGVVSLILEEGVALRAEVSNKNRQNKIPEIQCVALSDHWGESYFKILHKCRGRNLRPLVSCRGLRRVACARRVKYADHLVQPYMCVHLGMKIFEDFQKGNKSTEYWMCMAYCGSVHVLLWEKEKQTD